MTWTASFYYVFLYLACFVVNTYVIFILVCWILMAYASLAIYLLYLQDYKRDSTAVSKRRDDYRQVYIVIMESK